MSGVFSLGLSLVSWTVTIVGLVVWISCLSSVILFRIPFILICIILKSLSLVVCGLVVEVLEEEEDEDEEVDDGEEVDDEEGVDEWNEEGEGEGVGELWEGEGADWSSDGRESSSVVV